MAVEKAILEQTSAGATRDFELESKQRLSIVDGLLAQNQKLYSARAVLEGVTSSKDRKALKTEYFAQLRRALKESGPMDQAEITVTLASENRRLDIELRNVRTQDIEAKKRENIRGYVSGLVDESFQDASAVQKTAIRLAVATAAGAGAFLTGGVLAAAIAGGAVLTRPAIVRALRKWVIDNNFIGQTFDKFVVGNIAKLFSRTFFVVKDALMQDFTKKTHRLRAEENFQKALAAAQDALMGSGGDPSKALAKLERRLRDLPVDARKIAKQMVDEVFKTMVYSMALGVASGIAIHKVLGIDSAHAQEATTGTPAPATAEDAASTTPNAEATQPATPHAETAPAAPPAPEPVNADDFNSAAEKLGLNVQADSGHTVVEGGTVSIEDAFKNLQAELREDYAGLNLSEADVARSNTETVDVWADRMNVLITEKITEHFGSTDGIVESVDRGEGAIATIRDMQNAIEAKMQGIPEDRIPSAIKLFVAADEEQLARDWGAYVPDSARESFNMQMGDSLKLVFSPDGMSMKLSIIPSADRLVDATNPMGEVKFGYQGFEREILVVDVPAATLEPIAGVSETQALVDEAGRLDAIADAKEAAATVAETEAARLTTEANRINADTNATGEAKAEATRAEEAARAQADTLREQATGARADANTASERATIAQEVAARQVENLTNRVTESQRALDAAKTAYAAAEKAVADAVAAGNQTSQALPTLREAVAQRLAEVALSEATLKAMQDALAAATPEQALAFTSSIAQSDALFIDTNAPTVDLQNPSEPYVVNLGGGGSSYAYTMGGGGEGASLSPDQLAQIQTYIPEATAESVAGKVLVVKPDGAERAFYLMDPNNPDIQRGWLRVTPADLERGVWREPTPAAEAPTYFGPEADPHVVQFIPQGVDRALYAQLAAFADMEGVTGVKIDGAGAITSFEDFSNQLGSLTNGVHIIEFQGGETAHSMTLLKTAEGLFRIDGQGIQMWTLNDGSRFLFGEIGEPPFDTEALAKSLAERTHVPHVFMVGADEAKIATPTITWNEDGTIREIVVAVTAYSGDPLKVTEAPFQGGTMNGIRGAFTDGIPTRVEQPATSGANTPPATPETSTSTPTPAAAEAPSAPLFSATELRSSVITEDQFAKLNVADRLRINFTFASSVEQLAANIVGQWLDEYSRPGLAPRAPTGVDTVGELESYIHDLEQITPSAR